MAPKLFSATTVLIWLTLLTLSSRAAAQSGCTAALLSLTPCLSYVSGNSSTPTSSCCSQLSGVVQSQPSCLCALLNGGTSSIGVTINQTKALALPGACRVQTPPISRCNANNGPSTPESPTDAPADEVPQAPVSPSPEPNIPSVIESSAERSMGATIGLLGCIFLAAVLGENLWVH